MRSPIVGLPFIFALPLVAAHGFVDSITIDGKRYEGNSPGSNNAESPIRTISTIDPVKGATNRAINCGPNAEPAALVADANPGSTIEFSWSNGQWPHNTGPILTYLASCGDTTCDQFDAINAQWFKIDQVGKKSGSSEWFQQDIMNGQSFSVNLPDNLASGQYLVRHEIIGLHLAQDQGGAEFYPSCAQINVGGSETGTPSSDELVSFPGGYSDTDPGILVNAFNNDDYDFPGPKISTLAGSGGSASGGSSGSGSGPSNSGSSSSSSNDGPTRTRNASSGTATPDGSSSAGGSSSSGTSSRKRCGVKRSSKSKRASTIKLRSLHPDEEVDARPHRVSRVMRSLYNPH